MENNSLHGPGGTGPRQADGGVGFRQVRVSVVSQRRHGYNLLCATALRFPVNSKRGPSVPQRTLSP